jgi:sarcosine oxidase subunit alpha
MTAIRLPAGGAIDRAAPIHFTWQGRRLTGYAGDTLASALLANGVRVVARSYRLHRPRGLWGAGAEEPNAVVDVTTDEGGGITAHDPNARATLVGLRPGLAARAVNAWPCLHFDATAAIDLLHPFLAAGFYYKTFFPPHWPFWERRIRAVAGLGRVREEADRRNFETRHAHCDVLVIGAGPAGLAAARAAAAAGLGVLLVDDNPEPGGSLQWRAGSVEGATGAAWAAAALDGAANVTWLANTTAFGAYDHGSFGLIERRDAAASGWARERLWLVRARHAVLATGAIERPLVFPDNDRPGVMSADAVLRYLRRWGVRAGRRVLVATTNDSAYEVAAALAEAGCEVVLADARPAAPAVAAAAAERGVHVRAGMVVCGTAGRMGVRTAELAPADAPDGPRERLAVDLVAVAGGWSPTVHLHCHAGGALRWDAARLAFLPTAAMPGMQLAGTVAGAWTLADCLADGHRAGVAAAHALGRSVAIAAPHAAAEPEAAPPRAVWQLGGLPGRQWVDFHNDVTTTEIRTAAAENYAAVEHLKRYTTLGMAADQGRTSNVNGIAVLAAETGRGIAETGTTRFRPPYTPVSFGALAGLRHGATFVPLRHLPAHDCHRAAGAEFRDYGGWNRPACYPRRGESTAQAIRREAAAVRAGVGLFDGSSLGKIEVDGADAVRFLDLMYFTPLAGLKPGRLRYAILLRETGIVFDDGIVGRLAPDRFLLSPSSSHTAGVLWLLEQWRQTEYPSLAVACHDVTAHWATLTLTGPKARAVLARLATDIDLTDAALPHMAMAAGRLEGVPCRLARASFTGEASYEVSVPAGYAAALWQRLREAGAGFGITPFGIEALSVLRAEKGYILIGADTDGTTMPADLGLPEPSAKRTAAFVGRRSLATPDARRPDRRQFVGLLPDDPAFVPAVGSHAVVREQDGKMRSIGWITTACHSPVLGRSIALGMIAGGRALAEAGATVELFHLGATSRAVVTRPCFVDPAGEKLHA